jgi:K+-sensing histidine kinase KdpD
MGELYLEMNSLNNAYFYLNKALVIANSNEYDVILRDTYFEICRYFEKRGNIDSAYAYLKKVKEQDDKSDLKEIHKTFELQEVQNKLTEKNVKLEKVKHAFDKHLTIWSSITLAISILTIFAFVRSSKRKKKMKSLKQEKDILEETLRQAENLFVETKESKDNSAKLAHVVYREFRDQIQGIMFSSDILEKEIRSNKFSKNYTVPIKILSQTSKILRNFLDYMILLNDINRGDLKVHLEDTNISEIVCRCIRIMQNRAKEKNISINHIENFLTAETDRNIIEFVVMCLLSNAIKYSQANSKVDIAYIHDGRSLKVEFTDFGLGVEEENIDICMPEKIKSRTGTAGEKGTGLSLIIACKMVKIIDAEIAFHNNPTCGTTFSLSIPNASERLLYKP